MDADSLSSLIDQYARHGWTLRRAFGSKAFLDLIHEHEPMAAAVAGDLDLIWFSRRSLKDAESWELRRVSGSPYAHVVVIPDAKDEAEREQMLADAESRIKQT